MAPRIRSSFAWILLLAAAGACSSGREKTAVAIDAGDGDSGRADAGATGADAGAGGADAGRDSAVEPSRDAGHDAGSGGTTALPQALSETGLYASGSTSTLADGVVPYEPRYVLWSDGADKQRYLYLPPGTQIDTSDMDRWRFPVGTKVWKEFSRSGRRLETRLLWKTSETGWFQMAFVWNADGSDATAAPRGAMDVAGTTHDVPARNRCSDCHDGAGDKLLGISAIQLSHDRPGANLKQLASEGRLSQGASGDFRLPEDDTWNALGYLHANCGNCHNPGSVVWDKVDLDLWLRTGELGDPVETQSYRTTVSVALTDFHGSADAGVMNRVAPGDAAHSGLILRMTTRGNDDAMPPIASEIVDDDGVALVSKWIDAL
jgi:hypothetical protein